MCDHGHHIPVAAGIAILRYRLYEIDRIINRTVVYGVLTVILGLGYASVVLVLGQLFGGVTRDPPSWAVAVATLAVAALFQPARRIQAVVDRRFNRRKFDATKTVEAFSVRLRDEVDLDALTAELLAVVDQTIQPTRTSLWLRPSVERSLRTGTSIAPRRVLAGALLASPSSSRWPDAEALSHPVPARPGGVPARLVSNLVSIGGSGPVRSRTPAALRSSATRDRSAGRARQG